MHCIGLMHYRPNPVSLYDCPDEEGKTGSGYDVRLHRKEVPNLVNGELPSIVITFSAYYADKREEPSLFPLTQIAGRLQSQNMKKLTKSLVLVPEEAGMLLGSVLKLLQTLRIMRYTQVPPIQDCTPYQMHAMAARLKMGQSDPHTPNEARDTTGNPM